MTQTVFGRLQLSSENSRAQPLIVHQNTCLGDLVLNDGTTRHVFVTDDTNRIIGIVPGQRILERLNCTNLNEADRWATTPVSYLLKMTFPADSMMTGCRFRTEVPCMAIFENGSLLGIASEEDVFVSWNRLTAAVTSCTADPLTGLMNRAAYERRLAEEWERAQRAGFSIAVIVVDLDHFKSTNDRFGHDVGDHVLRQVARIIEASLRSYDVLVRYGGDEFVALCVGCRPGEIGIPIQRILKNLREAQANSAAGTRMSASVGGAVRHAGFDMCKPESLFAAADECLYLAKVSRDAAYWIELGLSANPQPESFITPFGTMVELSPIGSNSFTDGYSTDLT